MSSRSETDIRAQIDGTPKMEMEQIKSLSSPLYSDSNYIRIDNNPLDIGELTKYVTDPGAGGIATFIGTTRDTFDGKQVLRLEYEGYIPMALKELLKMCHQAREKWTLSRIAIAHRLGVVDIAEASVMIAVSSVHRKECLEACHWMIDALKMNVPIWKKEVLEDGDSIWKENKEWKERGEHAIGK